MRHLVQSHPIGREARFAWSPRLDDCATQFRNGVVLGTLAVVVAHDFGLVAAYDVGETLPHTMISELENTQDHDQDARVQLGSSMACAPGSTPLATKRREDLGLDELAATLGLRA